MGSLPFPSNENQASGHAVMGGVGAAPWQKTMPTEGAPVMFQVRFCHGGATSYAYCDLREIRVRDAGLVQLGLLGMEKLLISISGRHLTELAELIAAGKIKSFTELGPRTFDRPEASPSIDKITVETLTGYE
ncbi:hypothetical protein [Botrimarina mediterranea]|uniref:Uncharacterized protein n=1 Tax=Botrimarina mediterranea TaxID=2528022 RepID=A0A518K7V2_9BACT|nr:hypothetical protein [Botrimarina mediterranea]QDV73860.1 hypothetical protein Spa11_20590 [Botrimarina mediterranea]QDV78490.1 hypothetical protein K2D_20970 [Planctomycetes bacterium K2D]